MGLDHSHFFWGSIIVSLPNSSSTNKGFEHYLFDATLWSLPPPVNGHFRKRFIGGTYHIYIFGLFFRPMFLEIYPQFIWPNIWYSSTVPPINRILEISHWPSSSSRVMYLASTGVPSATATQRSRPLGECSSWPQSSRRVFIRLRTWKSWNWWGNPRVHHLVLENR